MSEFVPTLLSLSHRRKPLPAPHHHFMSHISMKHLLVELEWVSVHFMLEAILKAIFKLL